MRFEQLRQRLLELDRALVCDADSELRVPSTLAFDR